MLANIGKELYEFVTTAQQMPQQIEDAFASATVARQLANDQLDFTNVKLEAQIAKFEHKPLNTLAEAFAEARVKADELAVALDTDTTKPKRC